MGKIVKIEDLVYKTDKYVHNFQQYEIIRSFSKSIFARKISLDDSDWFIKWICRFKEKSKTKRYREKKAIKIYCWKHRCTLWR